MAIILVKFRMPKRMLQPLKRNYFQMWNFEGISFHVFDSYSLSFYANHRNLIYSTYHTQRVLKWRHYIEE